jgi:hypothetical protein
MTSQLPDAFSNALTNSEPNETAVQALFYQMNTGNAAQSWNFPDVANARACVGVVALLGAQASPCHRHSTHSQFRTECGSKCD